MPTFDRAHTIAEAVHSVLGQSYGNWELLVCDDGSTDRTALGMAQMADQEATRALRARAIVLAATPSITAPAPSSRR